ncbi:YqzL family protein [Litchfieldia alkalitelluris]|nr:YqzL family protein [Litchfieldia alkalitelluris]
MLDFTWKVFSKTGNIDTYLLFKQMETEEERPDSHEEELAEVDFPIS